MTQPACSENDFLKETFSQEALTIDEKFELLSAYLDDEVTDEERCLVEHWLSSDLHLQRQYQEQLKLRLAMRAAFGKPSFNDTPADTANSSNLSSNRSSLTPARPVDPLSEEPQSLQTLSTVTSFTTVPIDGVSTDRLNKAFS
jgi:anti-sigma factor RsiW